MASTTTLSESPRTVDYTEYVRLATTGANWKAQLSSFVQPILTGNVTYYVRTDGSDSNTGLVNSAGGAFLTIQKAYNVAATFSTGNFTITIQVGNGTYTGGVILGNINVGDIVIQGDTTTPSNVVVSTTSADCFAFFAPHGSVTIQGFKLQTTTGGACVSIHSPGCAVTLGNMEYGATAAYHIFNSSPGSQFVLAGTATISGGGLAHIVMQSQSYCYYSYNSPVTVSGTPAFSTAFAYIDQSRLDIVGTTYSGSATGTRYLVVNGGVVSGTGSTTFFPGNVAGSGGTSTGGGYYS